MESFHKHNPQNHERKIENSGFRPRRFYTLGPTQYSSLWNFFIDKSSVCDRSWKSFSYFLYDLQGRSKSKEKFRSSNKRCCFLVCFTFCGSAVFTRNRLTESEAESSWNYLSHPIDHYSSFRLTRLFESRLSKQEKFDPHTRYLEVLTKQFIRFLVPQLSLGTGLLNQKSNPHFITSVLMASYRFLNENFLSSLNHLWLIQESDPSESEAGSS